MVSHGHMVLLLAAAGAVSALATSDSEAADCIALLCTHDDESASLGRLRMNFFFPFFINIAQLLISCSYVHRRSPLCRAATTILIDS